MDGCFQYQSSVNLLEMSFPLPSPQSLSSSFWDSHNCDLWHRGDRATAGNSPGRCTASAGDGKEISPGKMGTNTMTGKSLWNMLFNEEHWNLGRDVWWDTQNFKKNIRVFQLLQFSVGISAKYMEGIQVLAFPTHPTAGAGYSQLIWFETWFILCAKSCLKFSNTFIFFFLSGITHFPGLKAAWEATDSSALKCDMAKAGVILACLNIVITVGK